MAVVAKNLASAILSDDISASTTTFNVASGTTSSATTLAMFPSTANYPFYVTIMPNNPTAGVANTLDSEIVRVTDISAGTGSNVQMTVIRGQRGTTAKAFSAGAIVTNAVYADDFAFVDSAGDYVTSGPWVENDDIDWADMDAYRMLGMIIIGAAGGTTSFSAGSGVHISDEKFGNKTVLYEYDPLHCLNLSGSVSTAKVVYLHRQGVKLIETEAVFGGKGYGLWQNNANWTDNLNGATAIDEPSGILCASGGYSSTADFGTCVFKNYIDPTTMTVGNTCQLDPIAYAYRTTWGPTDGLKSKLIVRLYGE